MRKDGGMDGVGYIGTFNNEDRDDVAEIKRCAAQLIDHINNFGANKRRASIACTHVETAVMFAVKSIFTEE
jgi:hypothetical protein